MAQRVLVVDDSPTIRKVVANVLTKAGFETGQAGDGVQALQILKKEKYDVALVDFVMPRLNGFELCRKIREDEALKELPVVLMSVKADKIREHFLRQTGALDAITKPFDPRALVLAIEGALQKIEEGKNRRPQTSDTVPPTSGEAPISGEPGAESTLTDSSAGPASLRAPAPDAFVRRIGEVLAKIQSTDGAQATVNLRKALGDEGLSTLYYDLVGSHGQAVLTGDLAAIPLAEVLQLLQLQRQTGLLNVWTSSTEVQIAMREGLVDLATSRGAADEFRLGRYVIEGGRLDRAQLDDFIKRERASGKQRLLGDALVAEGILTREDIGKALARQTSELIYDVLRWTRGRFVFDVKATRAEASAAQLGLPVASIVMEGFRRVDEWRLMEGALGDFEQVFYRDPGAIEAMGTSRLSREERAVLMAIDGERSVRDLIGAVSMGSFDVCKILYQFVQSRLVRRRL
jgi:CheY-like chemotaxis protein